MILILNLFLGSVCLCVHTFVVPVYVLLRFCMFELWCSIVTDSHPHKTAPMSTRLGCCPHSTFSYPSFFSSTHLVWAGDKLSGCVRVCLPLTLVRHILSVVAHKDWVEIELGMKRIPCVGLLVWTYIQTHTCCVHHFMYSSDGRLCHSYQTSQLNTHTNQQILLATIALNKDKQGAFSPTPHTSSNCPLLFASPLNKTQHHVVTQRGTNKKVITKKIWKGSAYV